MEYPQSTGPSGFHFMRLVWGHASHSIGLTATPPNGSGGGHGEALVRLNFWFFLFVYYGFYNTVGLLWITKLFNIYSMNWLGAVMRLLLVLRN
jgi:hypothetical protein